MSNETTPPSDAKGEDDISDINHDKTGGDYDWMFAKLNRHLAALKLVRAPGKGKLTVGEAVATTLAQAEAYESWCRFGAPGGVIEVWVEEKRVVALHPDGATDLHGVLFESAGLPKAVVQVVRRADEIADTVVLLNRELRDVLHRGGRCEQQHPNNRHVTLEVKRESRGQLSFWVGFNQPVEVTPGSPGVLERLKVRAARAGACLLVRAERLKVTWGVPALGTATVGLTLVVVCAGLALSSRGQTGVPAAAGQPEAAAASPTAAVSDDAPAGQGVLLVVKNDGGGTPGASPRRTATVAPDVKKGAALTKAVRPRLAATRVNVVAPKDELVSQDEAAVALTTLTGPRGAAAESSPWDAQRLRRLAEVKKVVLEVDEKTTTTLDEEQAEDLLASLKEALEELGIVALTDESERRTADGVMLVRFEPDTTLLGAIFATMRDRRGNFLWEDHADCRVEPDGGGWGATFEDASARLLSKLPPRTKVASNQGDGQPRAVAGSKFAGRLPRRPPAAPGSGTDAPGYEKRRVAMSQVVTYERR